MKRVDDFRLKLGKDELVPIMIGGMGVDISTAELALVAARLGGIGHISDALVHDVSDRRFGTSYIKEKPNSTNTTSTIPTRRISNSILKTWLRRRACTLVVPWKPNKARV
jgi:hypothetical protein